MRLVFQDTLPADLRTALEDDARLHDITMNDAAGRVLARRFDTAWTDTGAKFHSVAEPFRLRVDDELWLKLRLDAVARDGTIRGVILDTLYKHYGFDGQDVRRRPRAVA